MITPLTIVTPTPCFVSDDLPTYAIYGI